MTFPFGPLRQPDPRSCGAAVTVVHRMLRDRDYADHVREGFDAEVLATHRRLTGWRHPGGGLQMPWSRALGTPPWSIAQELTHQTRTAHGVNWVLPWRRAAALESLREALVQAPVPLYVGNRWLPRHVVLVVDPDLLTYNPGSGGTVRLTADAFLEATLPFSRWTHPWAWVG